MVQGDLWRNSRVGLKMSEEYDKQLQEKGGKMYKIELTCAELEFIKDFLSGINDFMQYLHAHFHSTFEFERGLEKIRPDDLADKIFTQYHNGDGDFI